MRTAASLACAALLFAGLPAGAQRAAPFVPFGVWYGGGTASPPIAPRDPASERGTWRADLEAIRALGFNTVTGWVDWAGAEPRPGEYRLDALEQLLTLAGETGLRVIVQLYLDVPPGWMAVRQPEATVPPAGARLPCFDDPDVRARLQAFVDAVGSRAAKHDAFYAIDLSSGASVPGPADAAAGALELCPDVRPRFREWLQRKYGTLEALNAAWGAAFPAWGDVTLSGGRDFTGAAAIDRGHFDAVRRLEDLRFLALASASRGARLTAAHAAVPAVVRGLFAPAGPDDWWMGSAVDRYGAAVFPRVPSGEWPDLALPAALDGLRSAAGDRGWWAARLQAGQGVSGTRVSPPVTAADVRLWGWAALSRGARAVSYFAWYPMRAGDAAHGYGLVELDGRMTERARAAGAVASIVSRNPALFAPLRPRPSRVAVVYDPLARFAGDAAAARAQSRSMLGFHRALLERNIGVDVVHADEMAAGAGSRYRVLFLPSPLMLQRGVASGLAAYVQAGGTVVSEARPAWRDETGLASPRVPGLGLDQVFGAREKQVRPSPRGQFRMERELDGPLSRFAGRTIPAGGPIEHLEISGANVRVLARVPTADGSPGDPAIVLSRHGRGQAILIGGSPAAAFDEEPEAFREGGDLLAALVEAEGVAPEVRIADGGGLVEARYLESPDATVIVMLNHAETPREVTLTFTADTPEAIWLNLESGASVHFVAGPEGPVWTHTFEPRGVAALMIRKEYR